MKHAGFILLIFFLRSILAISADSDGAALIGESIQYPLFTDLMTTILEGDNAAQIAALLEGGADPMSAYTAPEPHTVIQSNQTRRQKQRSKIPVVRRRSAPLCGDGMTIPVTEHTINISRKKIYHGSLALHVASAHNRGEIINTLLLNGPIEQMTTKDCLGNTPLHTAAYFGKKNVLKIFLNFLKRSPDYQMLLLEEKNHAGHTPLMAAYFSKYSYSNMKLLIEHGASINVDFLPSPFDEEGKSLAMKARAQGRLDIFMLLIKNGAPMQNNATREFITTHKLNVLHEFFVENDQLFTMKQYIIAFRESKKSSFRRLLDFFK